MDGQYWKGDRTMSTNEWLLTSDFWQFLEPWHGRWYEYEIFIASCTYNIYDLENERWLLGDMIDHVGIYGSKVAEGLSAFNAGLVEILLKPRYVLKTNSSLIYEKELCPEWCGLSLNKCNPIHPKNIAIMMNFLFIVPCITISVWEWARKSDMLGIACKVSDNLHQILCRNVYQIWYL